MLPRGYVDLRHGSDQDRRGQLLVSPKERGHAEQELHGNIGRSQVKPANYTELGIYVVLWYVASAICFNTTKQLQMHWSMLTLVQLSASSVFGACFLFLSKAFPYQPIASTSELLDTLVLASIFTGGFVTLNIALGLLHVSLVSSLRGCEPVTTLLLASYTSLLARQHVWRPALVHGYGAIGLIVLGCMLSVSGSTDTSAEGVVMTMICNACWSLRSVLTKRMQSRYVRINLISLFLHTSIFGALLQAVVVATCYLTSPPTAHYAPPDLLQPLHAQPQPPHVDPLARLERPAQALPRYEPRDSARQALSHVPQTSLSIGQVPQTSLSIGHVPHTSLSIGHVPHTWVLALNCVTFYTYLLMSWIVLSRVSLMTHSVMNALRLPFISIFGWLQYRNRMTGWNVLGLILATAGTLLFHSSRHAAGAIRSLQPSHQPC